MGTQPSINFLSLLEDQEPRHFADAEIHSNGRVWKVHKVILSVKSLFFKAAFTGPWIESTSGRIDLDAVDPDVLDVIINYMYGGTALPYGDPEAEAETDGPAINLEKYVALWTQADYFQLLDLKKTIADKIEKKLHLIIFDLSTFTNRGAENLKTWVKGGSGAGDVMKRFLADLGEATKGAYEIPAARKLQTNFMTFILAIRHHMPEPAMKELIAADPYIAQDAASVWVKMHLTFAGMGKLHQQSSGTRDLSTPPKEHIECLSCHANIGDKDTVTLDPWSDGKEMWCLGCGKRGISQKFEEASKAMAKTG